MIQYTQEDVARLLADERIRGIYLCNLLLEKLKKQQPNAKGEIKASIGRAHGILNGLFFDLIGGTITKDRDFDEQIMDLSRLITSSFPNPEASLSMRLYSQARNRRYRLSMTRYMAVPTATSLESASALLMARRSTPTPNR